MAAAARLGCVLRVAVGAGRTFAGSGLFPVTRTTGSLLYPAAWTQTRHSSFFNKLTADELWRGVLADGGAGSRKARGKRTKRKQRKDLNRGQSIGEGRNGFLWPGLNVPLIKGGMIQSFSKRGEAEQQELRAELLRQRDEWDRRRKMKMKRERGWSGNCWGGISLGPPDPGPNGETFKDFDCRIIELKSVFNMTAREGRRRSISALVAVGNGNGAAGFALGKAPDRSTALRKAKNRAMHYLYYIPRYNNHTVYHDVQATFQKTTLRIKKQNQGYGLHCHRAVITLCKLIGISDLYCKVDGSVNLLNVTRALFHGLANQEAHVTLADRTQLNVVEFSEERGPLPVVVARPRLGARSDPEVEDDVPATKLHWPEVQLAHGMKRSVWAGVKRTIR